MRAGDCKHFRGIQNECGAGVDPKSVRDASGKGPYKWPCLARSFAGATTTCAKFQAMTKAEETAQDDADTLAAVRFLADRCPTCGATLTVVEGSDVRIKSCAVHGHAGRECGVTGKGPTT